MAAISQTIYSDIFLWMKKLSFFFTIPLKFVLKAPIDTHPALGAKPLSEPMLTRLTEAYMRHEGELS